MSQRLAACSASGGGTASTTKQAAASVTSAAAAATKVSPKTEMETVPASSKDRGRSSSTVRALNFDDPELQENKKNVVSSPPPGGEKKDDNAAKLKREAKEDDTGKSKTIPTTVSTKPSVVKKEAPATGSAPAAPPTTTNTTTASMSSKPISSPVVVSASKPPHSSSPKQQIQESESKPHGSPSKGSLKKLHQQAAIKSDEPPKPTLLKSSSVPAPAPPVPVSSTVKPASVPTLPAAHPISQLATPVITTAAAASPTATSAPPAAVVLRPSSGTGLQKSASYRKSSYKPQHSHSLRYSGSGSDISNLVRVRNSTLGNSAPTLSITSKDACGQRRSTSSSSARSGAVARHRLSFVANISPRSHSPIPASPIDSPRINSPSIIHFPFVPIKRITNKNSDSRRWSVASLPSSGYVTTPGSSNISSQCSSQEKLHQFPPVPTNDDLHMLSLHFSSNDSNPGMDGSRHPHHSHAFHHHNHLQHHHHHHHSLQHSGTSFNPPVSPHAVHYQHTQQQPLSLQSHATHCNSPHSVKSTGSCKDELNNVCGCRSPVHRPRSRSLSSPSHSPITDNEISLMNTFYKERFPKATQQMEERLSHFINENKTIINDNVRISQPIVRFVHHQVLEMARDCLHKSHAKLITSRYFYEMNENLERLLMETKEKSPEAAPEITGVIKKLLLIISRPARLLECLEFDPEEFYRLLEVAEGQAKITQGIKADIPQYIIQKLGLNRDPIAELQEELIESASLNSSINTTCDSSDNNNSSSPNQSLSGGKGTLNRSGSLACSTPKAANSLNSSINTLNNNNQSNTSSINNNNSNSASGGNKSFKARANSAVPSEKDYDILKLISNGAYGAVYLVKHKQTRQRFAMKKINKNSLMLRNQVEQVFAERDILSFADNPFVVSMYCSFETKKHLCLVMEYVEGGDCATLLKNIGPLPSDMARFYFAETVLAVEYLHSYGIVHRDLKPDNLLITALGHIKLTDFGLSKMGLMSLATNLYEGYLDSETRQFSDKQVFGTPEYIAPEVILRQGYGKPVDWWSMGIILYEFLIGCVPFFGETPEELFAHTVNDDIEWPDNDDWPIQDEAKDLITVLLQQNPRDRLGTGGAHEVKEHCYFFGLDWNNLLRQKAEFVPQLDNEEDTSYFDTRVDRYNHDICGDDTDDMEDSPLFGSFNSYSPQYRKQQSISAASGGSPSILAAPQPEPLASPLPGTTLPLTMVVAAKEKQQLPSLFEDSFDTNNQPKPAGDISKLIITPELRKFNINPSKYKMPSTPDLDYLPELATPDREDFISHLNLRPHVQQQVPTTPETPETNKRFSDFYPLSSLKQLSTPESSQTDSDDVSPQIQRKRKIVHSRGILPKFSISIEDDQSGHETSSSTPSQVVTSSPSSSLNNLNNNSSRHIVKSASALGLSLMTSSDDSSTAIATIGSGAGLHNVTTTASNLSSSSGCSTGITSTMHSAGNCSSTASSRDTSPCRELSPLVTNLKPPLIIRRGPRGFGFTVHTIRVYYGDTDFYTMHHLVMAVDEGSPAFEAGLRPADLITHVNGEAVQGLYHTQVLQLLLSGAELVSLRATPLEHTSIQSGGRKREPWQSKFAKKSTHSRRKQKKDNEKKRKTSLFRRISSKRASAEMQQMVAGIQSPTSVPPSRSFQSFTRFQGSQPNLAAAAVVAGSVLPSAIQPVPSTSLTASPVNRLSLSPLNTITAAAFQSSPSSSPSTSAPSTPTGTLTYNDGAPLYQRPSTLHVLKHKLHSSPCGANSKALHTATATGRPNRRKSADHMPLSPLARTPSPSPLPASPTRSSSPLAFPVVHPLGSSNTTQSYSPGVLPNSTSVAVQPVPGIVTIGGSPTPPTKKGFPRAKTAEPSSPLLRRALSPDRLHPRSAESKCVLSPLCCNTPLKTPRQVTGIWRSNQNSTITTATPPSATAGPVTTAPVSASQAPTSVVPAPPTMTTTASTSSKVVTSAPVTATTNTVAAASTASSTGKSTSTISSSSSSNNSVSPSAQVPKQQQQLADRLDKMSIKEDAALPKDKQQ